MRDHRRQGSEASEAVGDRPVRGVAGEGVVDDLPAGDPHDQTVTIYRAKTEPELVNVRQELTGEPHLPGFHVPAAEIFA